MKRVLLILLVTAASALADQTVTQPTTYATPSSLTIQTGVPLLGTWNFTGATVTGLSLGGGSGTVTSITATTPIIVTPSPLIATGVVSLDSTSKTNWDTAYTDRLKWDGGATGLTAATGRTSLGLGTAAQSNVGDFQPVDADLTSIAALTTTSFGRGFLTQTDAAGSRSYIGAGTSNFDGTFTSLTGKPTTLTGYGITDAQPLDTQLTDLAALSYATNALKVLRVNTGATGWELATISAGGGTVTDFSAGDLSPLFTTTEATTTTTPALSFALTSAAATTVFGRAAGTSGAPTYSSAPQFLKIGNLTSNGFVKTGSSDGTLSVDTATYLTANQNISLTGDVTGGPSATSIATTIGANKVTLGMMATMATDSILGRATASTGNVEVLAALPWADTGDVTRAADGKATVLAAGNAGNLNSGTLLAARMPALTGEVTTTVGTVATTIADSVTVTGWTLGSSSITALSNLTTNGFVKTSGGVGTLSVDTSTYLTSTSISDTAYAGTWDTVTTIAPSKNAVYDKIETLQSLDTDLTALAGITGVRGDVLFYGASGWARLGVGTSGQQLTTGGAGADPSWAAAGSGGGGTPGGGDMQVQFNDASTFGGDAALTLNKTTDVLTVTGQQTIDFNNADYTNTAGAGSHLLLTNANGSGQNVISSYVNGGLRAKWRTDSSGNINWVAFGTSGASGHHFFTGGDYAVGNDRMAIFGASATISVPNSMIFGWESTAPLVLTPGGIDTALTRNAAGVVEVNNGTAGTYRDMKVRNLEITGTLTGGAGGGNVSNTGTPVADQLAVWTAASTVEGDSNLTFTGGGSGVLASPIFNAVTGFRIGGAAASGKLLIGNGTDFVASTPAYPNASATSGYDVRSDGTNFVAYPELMLNSGVTSQTPSTSDVYLTGSNIVVGAGDFKAKGQYSCKFDVVKSAGTGTIVLTLRIGTLGTTGDTSRITFTFPAGTSVADTGSMEVNVNWRTVGSGTSAVVSGFCRAAKNTVTAAGLWNTTSPVLTIVGAVSGGFASNTATNIGLSFNGGTAFAGTITTVQAQLQQP